MKVLNKALRVAFGAAAIAITSGALAANGPGVTDTEIKIGHIVPYSGPVSAYGTIGKVIVAYFQKVNDEGGINGRKIQILSLDDAYNPSRTVEQARRLVERDQVLMIFTPLGTAHNMAIRKYMNARKVPQLFISSGADRWGDPENFPWTMGLQPTYQAEGNIYAQQILANFPDGKIAILYQNDDFGKDNLKGLMDGLGDKARTMVVAEASYEVSDPTIDSQMVALKASGANIFLNISTPKFAAQAIRKAADIGWKPTQYLASVAVSKTAVIEPAGYDNAQGVISATYYLDPTDPKLDDNPHMQAYKAWFKKYYPDGDIRDSLNVQAYIGSQALEQTLKQAGDDLSRENIMKQAASLDVELPMLHKGIRVKTAADDFHPIESMQLMRFTGESWVPFGDVISR